MSPALRVTGQLSTEKASIGQGVVLTVEVTNGTASRVHDVAPSIRLAGSVGTLRLRNGPLPTKADLGPGERIEFQYVFDAAESGPVSFEVSASGNDLENAEHVQSESSAAALVIETGSQLAMRQVTAPTQANLGAELTLTATVSNDGQADAIGVTPSLPRVDGAGAALLLAGPTPASATLPGGSTQVFTWKYRATEPGRITFSVGSTGQDGNSGRVLNAAAIASGALDLDVPPALSLMLSAPTSVTSGQAFSATLVVKNVGTGTARQVSPSVPKILTQSGSASATLSATAQPAVDIPGGATASFRFDFSATGTGGLVVEAFAGGTDGSTNLPVTAAPVRSPAVTVLAPSALVISSITAPGTVNRGQTFQVAVTVRNAGGSTANAVLPSPTPPSVVVSGGAAAGTSTAVSAQSLVSGASATFTYSFRESGTAPGALVFRTGAIGTDATSGQAISASSTDSNLAMVVAPPQLVVEQVALPAKVSRGQAFDATVTVRNTGGSVARQVRPHLSLSVTGGASAQTSSAPAAIDLAAGARATFAYTYVETGTGAGTLTLLATAAGTDGVSGAAVQSAPASSVGCSVEVPAILDVVSFTVPGSTIRGQTFLVSMTVTNLGQATANAVGPVPNPPQLTISGAAAATTTSMPGAVSIAAGARQTFSWQYTENGTGDGILTFTASVRGTDANSGRAVSTPSKSGQTSILTQCDPAQYVGISLAAIESDFIGNVYPLLSRPDASSGCSGCHASTSGRLFLVKPSAADTFHLARAGGFLKDTAGSLLDRLTTTDPLGRMPRNSASWTSAEVQTISVISCKLKAYDAGAGATPADDQFPPNLLELYTGPASTYYDSTFLSYLQLKGKVKAVFNDDWIRSGVDKFQQNLGLFGGVDFSTRFVEARAATPEFLVGMDMVAKDVCTQAVTARTGPFASIDPNAELIDTPASQTQQLEAEAMPTKTTGALATPGWNLYSNGYVSTQVNFAATGSYTFTVRARGQLAGTDPPAMELRVGSALLTTFQVSSTTYADYVFTATVAGGTQPLAVAFTNDFYDSATGGDRNLHVDYVRVVGPAGSGTGTTRETAARNGITQLYSKVLFRAPDATEQTAAYTMLKDIVALNFPTSNAWMGLCEALTKHPDFLFTRPPSADSATGTAKQRLLLVRAAQDLLARPPSQAELDSLASGSATMAGLIDGYLSRPEFRDFYFHRMRIRTESRGTASTDEPARLWTYLMMNQQPLQQLLVGEFSVDTNFLQVARPAEHGRTGLLTMKGFLETKPGLPHYNYPARVMTDFMGTLFEVPPEVFDQRGTATAASTVDPSSLCYSCHRVLTPLAHQRLRWDDAGNYRTVDAQGVPIDDSDRNLVADYPYKGRGLEAFSTVAVRKEAFIRRTLNAHFEMTVGRPMRHSEDERVLYKELWDLNVSTNGNLKSILRAIVLSSAYQR